MVIFSTPKGDNWELPLVDGNDSSDVSQPFAGLVQWSAT